MKFGNLFFSCLFIVLIPFLSCTVEINVQGENEHIESYLSKRSDVIYYNGFETSIPGETDWMKLWGSNWEDPFGSNRLTRENKDVVAGTNAIRISYPKGGVGPRETGAQWPLSFENIENLQPLYDSLYLRYYVKFEKGFDFVKGGKLPGLMGGKDSYVRSGGNQPDGTNGWTMRFMWRTDGEAVIYAYLPEGKYKKGVWGFDISLNKKFIPGQWHCIEQFIAVNTIGKNDGRLKTWFDGDLSIDLDDVTYRTVDNEFGSIGGMYFSTFHGGNKKTWAPNVDSFAQFDGFVIAQKRVGTKD
ncbi:MAG: hypothetical protein JXR07_06420 [Reichenbachiella sp.]